MKIYNEAKTQELNLEELDFSKGTLQTDTIVVAHHEATPLVKGKSAKEIYEELKAQGEDVEVRFYRVLTRYNNGSTTVDEIKDEPDTPAKESWDETEDIQVYKPFSEEELARQEIAALKAKLSATDFKAIQYAAGEINDEEFEPYKQERKAWRERITELEEISNEGAEEE